MSEHVSKLTGGQRFSAVTTGTKNGERLFTQREFVASRDQEVEQFFIPASGDRLAQDRVFVEHPHGSVPALVVSGSVKVHA